MKHLGFVVGAVAMAASFGAPSPAAANLPGGGTGTGANVTLVDSGATVTLGNGIVSVPITKSSANIYAINYTYNNGGGATTTQMLSGGYNGGLFYWEFGGFGSGTFTYTLVADPLNPTGTNAVGDYAEVELTSADTSSGTVDIHFSMRRGSPGYYVTAIWSHDGTNPAISLGETRTNIYAGSIFNWMSVDAARNRQMEVTSGSTSASVSGAPKEVSLWTNGVYQGQYEDKYKYSADFGTQRVWGWSSVTTANPAFTGKNVGLWDVSASAEYYNGGPMKRELMCHIGTTILNMFNGSHYGGGTDGAFADGETWAKVYGPYFVYCNNVATTSADPAGALYADAQAQAAAEATAWPYAWFNNANYTPASGRGTVSGRMTISDLDNPNASAAGLWVGISQQPATSSAVYDFQKWMKNYQFWVKTDASGNFTIPNVIAGSNYTLYAFGPGAAGTFQSQALTGGSPPFTTDLPATPFAVNVTAGGTTSLGSITWTPTRVGPTVFEIGYPDRSTDKFRHGDDFWVSDTGPSAASPSPVWGKYLDYPIDFPSGVAYTVGTGRWATDWNYAQPVVTDSSGNYNASASTITFNLASTPSTGAQAASLYLALASDYQGPVIVTVNGINLGGVTTTATPSAESPTGYFPAYSSSADESDANIREGPHGCFSDERITFAGSLLAKGTNTITVQMRKGGYFANHAMYDYLRLELAGYVPPAPASVTGYAGKARALLSWPATPGATSYNVLRSTTSGSGYTSVATGVTGPACGSGPANATYTDTTAASGTKYYYVVQAVNPAGTSANSAPSAAVTPSATAATAVPAAPTGLSATPGDRTVTLKWTAPTGANFYTVQRGTVVNARGYVPYYTTLSNSVTSATFTDASVSNGATYSYLVTATNAVGGGTASAAITARPAPTAAPAAPATFAAVASAASVTLSWSAVSAATGYVVQRATASGGPYTFLQSVTETTCTDYSLSAGTTYYYEVAANNNGGTSAYVLANATTTPPAPTGLTATPGDAQMALAWNAAAGATAYTLRRGTASGQETVTVSSAASGTAFTDTGLANGTTYYYLVSASNAAGVSGDSNEASARAAQTFSQWVAAAFPGQASPSVTGPAADPDGDGVANLIEYYFGTNPAAADAGNTVACAPDGQGNLVLGFRMAKNLTGVTCTVQQSADLVHWSDSGVAATVVSDQGAYYQMQAVVPSGTSPGLFLRLAVTASN